EAAFFPKPIQKPHPPIWIGGGRVAFDRIVRAGNGWIAPPRPTVGELARDITELKARAEQRHRDPAGIGVASGGAARSVDERLAQLGRELGRPQAGLGPPACGAWRALRSRIGAFLRRIGAAWLVGRMWRSRVPPMRDYRNWVEAYDTLTDADRALILRHIDTL